eukprot:TRINITY_DN31703_c0_g1_i3.p3 TRINITY_DN31703_c0_g1~~TRINITY_DN31703_c0_g1_i3.p3  ORF type:complete len:126 (-),score=23.42 TRINITY_DN31703_c0_g1_i3:4-381(-)
MPPSVGLKDEDHLRAAEVALFGSNVMERTLRIGGSFLLKMFYGSQNPHLRLYLETRFDSVRTMRPPASRSIYREMFFICNGFIGRQALQEEVLTKGNFEGKFEGHDRWGRNIRDISGPPVREDER